MKIIIDEFCDASCTLGRVKGLRIASEPNKIKDFYYFKVFNDETDEFCRISMTEATIINADDEKLELSNDDINNIILFLNEKAYTVNNNPLDISNWELLILLNNDEAIASRNDCPYMYIDSNMKMPDYSKLIK